MVQEQIVVDVSPTGMVSIEAHGYQGNACAIATQQLEIVIGGQHANKKTDHKPEFSMPSSMNQVQKSTF